MMPALGFYGADKSLVMPHLLIRHLRRMTRWRREMHCHANPVRTNDCGCRDMARCMSAFYGGALFNSKMNPGLMRRESARHVSSCNYDCCYIVLRTVSGGLEGYLCASVPLAGFYLWL